MSVPLGSAAWDGAKRVATRTAVLILLAVWPHTALPQANNVTLVDDSYHYSGWVNGQHDGSYIEWWYFNFYDTQQNVQGIVTYFIVDPQNLTGHGLAQVAAVAYTPNGVVREIDVYPANAFSASFKRADVQIGGNSIQVKDPNIYQLTGQSVNTRLQWNIQYTRQMDPWFAADRMSVGTLSWESMDWLVYMPRALVEGQFVIDGHVYSINASGYHDHNWGEWIFSNALWNWAQYSQPGLAFGVGDFIGQPAGMASIEVDGQRTVFSKAQYKLLHLQWAFDRENQKWYPSQTIFWAENESAVVVLTMRAINTEPLRGDLPFPLPDVIIYEQTASYDGLIWKKDSAGSHLPAIPFHGLGFKEYTAKTR